MPFFLIPVEVGVEVGTATMVDAAAIAHTVELVGYAGTIGGAVGKWCADHHPCTRKRDISEGVPRMVLEDRAAVGMCNIPLYNFDICKNELASNKANNIIVTSSVPSPGGE